MSANRDGKGYADMQKASTPSSAPVRLSRAVLAGVRRVLGSYVGTRSDVPPDLRLAVYHGGQVAAVVSFSDLVLMREVVRFPPVIEGGRVVAPAIVVQVEEYTASDTVRW